MMGESRRIDELLCGYFNGVLTAQEVSELERWIATAPENATRFATFAFDHRAMVRTLKMPRHSELAGLTLDDFELLQAADPEKQATLLSLAQMEEDATVELVSITERLKQQELDERRAKMLAERRAASRAVQPPAGPRVIIIPKSVFLGALAATLLLAAWVTFQVFGPALGDRGSVVEVEPESPTPQVVATLEDADHAVWAGGLQLAAGQPMTQGEYRLTSGSARLRLDNGALAIVEAPARFTLNTADTIALLSGRLVGYCDPAVETFTVQTPYADYTDLGTAFGVSMVSGQASQLHVFEGVVRVDASQDNPQAVAQPVLLQRNEAVAVKTGPRGLTALPAADTDLFQTTRRYTVETANTGEVMDRRGNDQQWLVSSINGRQVSPPTPAVLMELPAVDPRRGAAFLPNRIDELAWIKADPALTQDPITTVRYLTEFDLGDLDPASAQLDLGFLADNYVSDIYLNGQKIAVPNHAHEPPYTELIHAHASEGFVAGINRIEVVVVNVWPQRGENYTGLVAELQVTAQRHWKATTPGRPAD